MLKINIKKVKNISLAAVFLLLSLVAIVQPSTTYAAASVSSSIGMVNYQMLMQYHPDTAQSEATLTAAIAQDKTDFNEKSANMNEQEKLAYYQQLQQGLQVKNQQLVVAIQDKVKAAIKEVADSKGLTIVVDNSTMIIGGQDITDDVMKKIMGK